MSTRPSGMSEEERWRPTVLVGADLTVVSDATLRGLLEMRLERIDRLESGDLYSGMRGWCGRTEESYRIEHGQLMADIERLQTEIDRRGL